MRKMLAIVVTLLLISTLRATEPKWVKVQQHQENKWGDLYGDVLGHYSKQAKWYGNRETTVHEVTHLLDGDLSNEHTIRLGRKVWAFYVGNSKSVVLDDPKLRRSQVVEFIPGKYREHRFNLYLQQNQDTWETRPLLILDEYIAYTHDGMIACIDYKNYTGNETTNGMFACLEFTCYATSLAMALEKYDNEYFNGPFKAFFAWQVERALKTYKEGSKIKRFHWSPDYAKAFKTDAYYKDWLKDRLNVDVVKILGE